MQVGRLWWNASPVVIRAPLVVVVGDVVGIDVCSRGRNEIHCFEDVHRELLVVGLFRRAVVHMAVIAVGVILLMRDGELV